MKLITILLLVSIMLMVEGCAGVKVIRDSEGRVKEIKQTGIFPVKGKIGDNELNSKFSILDLNISGIKNVK